MRHSLEMAVVRFLREIRESPAKAVDPHEIQELERALTKDERSDGIVARAEPCAQYTWQLRSTLLRTELNAASDEVNLGEPLHIVGFVPTLLLVDTSGLGFLLPPMEAIDVQLLFNRKAEYTATATERGTNKPIANYANMPGLDIATRIANIPVEGAAIFSANFQWAVDLATVAFFGWGDTQISLEFFVRFRKEVC